MAPSEVSITSGVKQADLDKCVHCGMCLTACPTYRELGLEADSPRGRIYQMVQIMGGAPVLDSHKEHFDLCLACRACETACPSGVPYGRMIEGMRAKIEEETTRPFLARLIRNLVFKSLLPSRGNIKLVGTLLLFYQASGLRSLVRASGILKLMGKMGEIEPLAPDVESPFFFSSIGKVFPAKGETKHRVAFVAGCLANVCFARLNDATVRVLQANGCEVTVPESQGCCGALHVHAGVKDTAQGLARKNIDAFLGQGFEAIITNAAGCGSTLKEYHELLEDDPAYIGRAHEFSKKVQDVTEFLGSIELNQKMGEVRATVTYQDSCHLAHGQKVRVAPRQLLKSVPGLTFKEMMNSDRCCGSAGIYNVLQTEMSMAVLETKMEWVNSSKAERIVTANPGCMLQLQVGAKKWGSGQKVSHVVEILDEAYRNAG